jgi:hypothetical protein
LQSAAIIVQVGNCFQNAWAAGDRMAGLVCFNWRVPLQGDWRIDHFGHIAGLTKPAVLGAIIAGLARGLPPFGAFFHRNPMFNDYLIWAIAVATLLLTASVLIMLLVTLTQ